MRRKREESLAHEDEGATYTVKSEALVLTCCVGGFPPKSSDHR